MINRSRRVEVLLNAQRALVGEVFPNLNEVDISWDTKSINLKFFLSSSLTEEDEESISAIETELNSDFPDDKISHDCVVGDKRNSQRGTVCIFARRPDDCYRDD